MFYFGYKPRDPRFHFVSSRSRAGALCSRALSIFLGYKPCDPRFHFVSSQSRAGALCSRAFKLNQATSLATLDSTSFHLSHGLAPYDENIKNPISHKCGWGFHISVAWLVAFREDYRFEKLRLLILQYLQGILLQTCYKSTAFHYSSLHLKINITINIHRKIKLSKYIYLFYSATYNLLFKSTIHESNNGITIALDTNSNEAVPLAYSFIRGSYRL